MRVRIIEPLPAIALKRKRVCAYARVSSDSEAQGESLENQTQYYQGLIEANPDYEFTGVFVDQGITGTKDDRPEFQKMLALARAGKLDLILTKSISRFARNTTIVLELLRELKELGVDLLFENEQISSSSGYGELMLTVPSAFAQEESKNINDNQKWRYRRKFQNGEVAINTTRFLGYDKNKNKELVINSGQEKVVKRIFDDYIGGKGSFVIAKDLNAEGVETVAGGRWHSSTILGILKNEKYMGDAKLQKTYSADHLRKKKCVNYGEIDRYYMENNHPPIIPRDVWQEAQRQIALHGKAKGNSAEIRAKYQIRYPLTGMLFCGKCGAPLRRRTWNSKYACRKIVWQWKSTDDRLRRLVWRCNGNYVVKGEKGCDSQHIDDGVLYQAFVDVFNALVENRDYFMEKWHECLGSDNVLARYKAMQFSGIIADAARITEFDINLYFALIEKIVIHDDGRLTVGLLEGTEVECLIK